MIDLRAFEHGCEHRVAVTMTENMTDIWQLSVQKPVVARSLESRHTAKLVPPSAPVAPHWRTTMGNQSSFSESHVSYMGFCILTMVNQFKSGKKTNREATYIT